MKFYGRETELQTLVASRRRSASSSQFTVVMGRRRIGKTRLILKSLEGEDYLYFFVSKKAEKLLCDDYLRQVKEVYGTQAIGEVSTFAGVFQLVCRIARNRPVNLVIDEFQEFMSINSAIYSDLQRDWDIHKHEMRLNLIVCGSVQSMMNRIFLDAGEPLFGRASSMLRIGPFSLATMREVLNDYSDKVVAEDLLALYVFTGGIPYYLETLMEQGATNKETMLATIINPQSLFLEEGQNVLIQDLGKEYATYFSILSLIASGFTSRPKIESVLQKPVGGQLTRLERIYGIIKRRKPVFSKENATDIRFYIADNFLRFWFRFVFKYRDFIETKNFAALKTVINRDYQTFAGLSLEAYLREQLRESEQYTLIGNYWERGNKNEIDIVAVNALDRTALIGEVKWQRERVNLAKLELMAERLQRQHLKGYQIGFAALGMEDIVTSA